MVILYLRIGDVYAPVVNPYGEILSVFLAQLDNLGKLIGVHAPVVDPYGKILSV